jgi:hypothetical protein
MALTTRGRTTAPTNTEKTAPTTTIPKRDNSSNARAARPGNAFGGSNWTGRPRLRLWLLRRDCVLR